MFPTRLRPSAWKTLLACLVGFGMVLHLPSRWVAVHNLGTGRSGSLGVTYLANECYSGRLSAVIRDLRKTQHERDAVALALAQVGGR